MYRNEDSGYTCAHTHIIHHPSPPDGTPSSPQPPPSPKRQVRLSSFHIQLADTHQTESSFVHLYEAVPKKSVAQLAGLKPPYVKRCAFFKNIIIYMEGVLYMCMYNLHDHTNNEAAPLSPFNPTHPNTSFFARLVSTTITDHIPSEFERLLVESFNALYLAIGKEEEVGHWSRVCVCVCILYIQSKQLVFCSVLPFLSRSRIG